MSKGALMMELEGDSQDDAFYAELERQILHLTADDDDDDRCGKFSPETRKYYGNPVGFDGERRGGSGQRNNTYEATLQQTETYYSTWEQEPTAAVPAGAPRLWPDGKGTGVFIPYIVGRKQRIGRKTKRTQKRGEKKTKGV